MTKHNLKSLIAALALSGGLVPATEVAAQNTIPLPGGIVPAPTTQLPTRYNFPNAWNIGARPTATPIAQPVQQYCGNFNAAAMMGPCQGPIGSLLRVQPKQNLGAAPLLLSFKAVVSRGIPARVHVRLSPSSSGYALYAPRQLCLQGGGSWEAELVLANGRNVGVIGGFTPSNCPR